MQSLAVLAALGFASSRAVQLVVHDTIGDPLRARLLAWHMNGIGPGRSNKLRSFVRDLLSCTYCAGWWLSMITYVVYATATGWGGTPLLVHAINAWAVAGIQALLNRIDDTLPVRG